MVDIVVLTTGLAASILSAAFEYKRLLIASLISAGDASVAIKSITFSIKKLVVIFSIYISAFLASFCICASVTDACA